MIGQAWIQQMQAAAQQQAVAQQTGQYVTTERAAEMLAPIQAALDQRVAQLVLEFAPTRQRAAAQQIATTVPRFTRWTREPHRQYIRSVIQGSPAASDLSSESAFFPNPQGTDPYFALRVLLSQDLTSPEMLMAIRRGDVAKTSELAAQAFGQASVASGQAQIQAVQLDLGLMAAFNSAVWAAQATARQTNPMAVATPKITWAKGVGADYIRAVRSRVVAEMVARARLVYDSSRPFRAVVEAIPWPHVFFKSFVYTPLVEPGPFRGVPFWDHEALMEQGYFTLSADRMRADLARWLSGNIDALQKHFEAEVKRFIKQKEAEAKRKAAPFIIVDWILQVFGFVASFVLPILGSIASAAISAGWKVLEASQVGQIQKDALRKILKVLKIDPASIDRLSAWVSEWATKAVPADVLDVRVEGRSVGTASSTDQAAALAVEQSQTGDRIEIISIPDGRSSGLLVRTETAVVGVPPTQEQAIQSMPPQSVQIAIATADAAQPKPSGFPVWIVPLVGMLVRS